MKLESVLESFIITSHCQLTKIALPKTSDLPAVGVMGLMRVGPAVAAGKKGLSRKDPGRGHARGAHIKADHTPPDGVSRLGHPEGGVQMPKDFLHARSVVLALASWRQRRAL